MTVVTEFFLTGFQGSQLLRNVLFLLFLIIYCATLCGNLLIIVLVSTSKNLQTPMYYFISQLSISDILVSTDIVPNMLHLARHNGGNISFIHCLTQFSVFCAAEVFECLLLTVMSYDRYVAICNPLHYTSVMTNEFCVKLSTMCWLVGILVTIIFSVPPSMLYFCGPSIIDHFFCELVPFVELACSDTFIVHLNFYILAVPILITPIIIIVVSYTYIVIAVLRISSSTGRQKAFSTCSSHLIVVSIFYWTIFSVYIVPTKVLTRSISKILSLLYTVFNPLVNPIIYSLRNKDIKKAIQDRYHKCLS